MWRNRPEVFYRENDQIRWIPYAWRLFLGHTWGDAPSTNIVRIDEFSYKWQVLFFLNYSFRIMSPSRKFNVSVKYIREMRGDAELRMLTRHLYRNFAVDSCSYTELYQLKTQNRIFHPVSICYSNKICKNCYESPDLLRSQDTARITSQIMDKSPIIKSSHGQRVQLPHTLGRIYYMRPDLVSSQGVTGDLDSSMPSG
jgi:hypothetical protein